MRFYQVTEACSLTVGESLLDLLGLHLKRAPSEDSSAEC